MATAILRRKPKSVPSSDYIKKLLKNIYKDVNSLKAENKHLKALLLNSQTSCKNTRNPPLPGTPPLTQVISMDFECGPQPRELNHDTVDIYSEADESERLSARVFLATQALDQAMKSPIEDSPIHRDLLTEVLLSAIATISEAIKLPIISTGSSCLNDSWKHVGGLENATRGVTSALQFYSFLNHNSVIRHTLMSMSSILLNRLSSSSYPQVVGERLRKCAEVLFTCPATTHLIVDGVHDKLIALLMCLSGVNLSNLVQNLVASIENLPELLSLMRLIKSMPSSVSSTRLSCQDAQFVGLLEAANSRWPMVVSGIRALL